MNVRHVPFGKIYFSERAKRTKNKILESFSILKIKYISSCIKPDTDQLLVCEKQAFSVVSLKIFTHF